MMEESVASGSEPTYLVIRCFDRNAGVTSLLTYAMNGIRLAESEGRIPVIYFDPHLTHHFYDPERGENIWNYFFESPGGVSYEDLEKDILSGKVERRCVRWLTSMESYFHHSEAPDRITTFWNDPGCESSEEFFKDRRKVAQRLVKKYFAVKPSIESEADEIFSQFREAADGPIWGVHIRGTDLVYTGAVRPENYFRMIRKRMKLDGCCDARILLATDQQQFVERFRSEFGEERILVQECMRGRGTVAPFKMKSLTPYSKGKEVLIDILLLSRCDFLFRGPAGVGEAAVWFSQNAKVVDLTSHCQPTPRSAVIGSPGALVTGANRNPLKYAVAWWTEFLERHVYAYAPPQGLIETASRLVAMGRRWFHFAGEHYHFADSYSLMANLTPQMFDFGEGNIRLPLQEGEYPLNELRASGEIVCPKGIFPDGWARDKVVLETRTIAPGTLTISGLSVQKETIEARIRRGRQEIGVRSIPKGCFTLDIEIEADHLHSSIELLFNRESQLDPPDERVVSVFLDKVTFSLRN